MIWLLSIFFIGGPAGLAVYFWNQMAEIEDDCNLRGLYRWTWQGVVAPLGVWVVMNLGKWPFMPPLTERIAQNRANGLWGQALLVQTTLAALAIVSYWSAVTFCRLMTRLLRRATNWDDLLMAALFWLPVGLLVGWALIALFGWAAAGFVAVLWLAPLAHYWQANGRFKRSSPTYSRAIGKIKFGKYGEAEQHIISQLEESENDFEGWLMLADLYASKFHDFAEAEKTIHAVCADPATTLSQISVALHQLADWHLKLRNDPAGAARALEEICARMPGTHLATMARHRINQLADPGSEINEQRNFKPIPLPPAFDALAAGPGSSLTVDQCVKNLETNPNDTASRERLARIFAEELSQPDLAIEQLELLLAMPDQPRKKMAEWLFLLAAWQLQHHGNRAAAREIWTRLIHEYQDTPHAFEAQRKIIMLPR